MKNIYIHLFILCLSISLNGQFWSYDTSFSTNIDVRDQGIIRSSKNILSFIDYTNSTYYFKVLSNYKSETVYGSKKNGMVIYSVNLLTKKTDSVSIILPVDIRNQLINSEDNINSLAISKDFAIIELSNKTLIFKRKKNKYNYISKIDVPAGESYTVYPLRDNKFIFSNQVKHYTKFDKDNYYILLYDAEIGKIIREVKLTSIGRAFGAFIHNWISITNDRIFICNPTGIDFKEYDFSLNKISEFDSSLKEDTLLNNELNRIIHSKSQFLPELKIIGSKTIRIEKIYAINDDLILLDVINPRVLNDERLIYYATKKSNKWLLLDDSLKLNINMPDNYNKILRDKYNIWHDLFWVNKPEYFIYKNKFFHLDLIYAPPFWLDGSENLTEKYQSYFSKNKYFYGITYYNLLHFK